VVTIISKILALVSQEPKTFSTGENAMLGIKRMQKHVFKKTETVVATDNIRNDNC